MVLRRHTSFFYIIPAFAALIVLSGLIPGTSIASQAQACGPITFPYTLPDNTPDTLSTAIECANANGTADLIDLNGFTVSLLAASPYDFYQAPTGLPQITSDITLRHGTIHNDMSGGGFVFRTFDIASSGTLTLQHVTLLGDMAPSPGGAFYNLGTLNVISSTITEYNTSSRGGVLYNGSGATANFTNALVYDNNAVYAHAIDNYGSVSIVNSTFDKHTSVSQFGVILDGSGYVIRNSILWNPGSGPGQIAAGNTVSHSIVKGGYGGGTNILDTDPLFIDEAGNDFRLQASSPAVNAGADMYVPTDSTDVDGDSNTTEATPDRDLNLRILGTSVDLGAYEVQTGSPPVDPVAVDYCNLQFPLSFTAASGSTSPEIYGRVYEDDNGVLTSSGGADPNIVGQLGYGPLGSDPRGGNLAWLWFPTTYNLQSGNDDEYLGTFTVPSAPANTQLSYTYRFSVDGGANYTYCDANGNGTNLGLGFSTADLGTLTISANDQPSISINDVTLNEGNSGTTSFTFTVSVDGPVVSMVTFDITTADGTASDGIPIAEDNDYAGNSLTGQIISSGNTYQTFTVLVYGDTAVEPNETFFVNLTNVTGADVTDGQGVGTIINDDVAASADLSITKTDGVASATPGGSVTYTITASNAGPSDVTGAMVADTFPASITGVMWTCIGAGGATCTAAGSGDINDTVNLPAGGSVTYTATGTIDPTATGTLSNTATVSSGVVDPNPANNSATDTDTLGASADLSITKTDGVASATPGGSVTYTITASNAGPSDAPSAVVADMLPAELSDATWTCVGAGGATCTAAGSGDINDTVNLPAGGSVTYTATGTIDPAATGALSNTATVSSGVVDPNPANNSATDTDTLGASADLSITKTDGVASATPGGSVTYTITASNAGPSDVTGATVADTFPASITGVMWTCIGAGGATCTAAGSGDINDTVNLPAGGSVTYTATGTIDPAATGTLSNTATVSSGVVDPNPANNSATDTDTLGASADLSITKTDGLTSVTQGGSVTYTITASNAGPSDAPSAVVADMLPAELSDATWTCVGAGGATCTAAGAGDINDTVNLPAGGSVSYTISAVLSLTATGTLSNTATVSADGITDPNPSNNSATDNNDINPLPVDLLQNGGFETAGGKPKKAKQWKVEAPTATDKRICKPLIAFEGSCAYRFRFNGTIIGGAKRAIVQKILAPAAEAGDTLDFSFYAMTSSLTSAGRARVIVKYGDGSKQVIKLTVPAGSSPYSLYAGSVVLTDSPISIAVKFMPRTSKGTMFIDGVSLTTTADARSFLATDVLPAPEAPEGFRR